MNASPLPALAALPVVASAAPAAAAPANPASTSGGFAHELQQAKAERDAPPSGPVKAPAHAEGRPRTDAPSANKGVRTTAQHGSPTRRASAQSGTPDNAAAGEQTGGVTATASKGARKAAAADAADDPGAAAGVLTMPPLKAQPDAATDPATDPAARTLADGSAATEVPPGTQPGGDPALPNATPTPMATTTVALAGVAASPTAPVTVAPSGKPVEALQAGLARPVTAGGGAADTARGLMRDTSRGSTRGTGDSSAVDADRPDDGEPTEPGTGSDPAARLETTGRQALAAAATESSRAARPLAEPSAARDSTRARGAAGSEGDSFASLLARQADASAQVPGAAALQPPPARIDAAPAAPPPSTEVRIDAPFGAPEWAQSVGNQISLLATDGVQNARLHLHPEEMGPITVQIVVEGQTAQVHLSAEHAHTREALEQAMPNLASSLRESGLTLTGGGVSEQSRQQEQQPSGEGRSTAGPATSVAAGLAPLAVAGPATRVLRQQGVVDLYA